MNFKEKELEILRQAVDKAETTQQKQQVESPELKQIIQIVEDFLRNKKLVCYGGTAINNILPVYDQFYDKSIEIPDYDFYSNNALKHAKELADIYAKAGFSEVEAKAGMHHGTYKVFVNYIPVADISDLDKELFKNIKRKAIAVDGILYAPPNFLRMAMYLELSRPKGDVSRWEKVLKRLLILNKHYPLKSKNCSIEPIQRNVENPSDKSKNIYKIVLDSIASMGLIFFGGYANVLYSKYMPKYERQKLYEIPDFDVLSEEPKRSATLLREKLLENGYSNITIKKHNGIGEIIAPHYEISVNNETIVFIYEPLACHSYNEINLFGYNLRIATIDTMLSFYLAFIYSDRPYYDDNRILCMAHRLFLVQQKNRLKQKGLLKRFSLKCYGTQATKITMRSTKSEMYKQLKSKRNSKEFEEWFLNYTPKLSIKNKAHSRVTKSKTAKKTKTKTAKSRNTKSRTAKSRIAKSNIVKSKLYNLFN
tara:strand:- start:5974 stop:7410 length:1437 start_codon:yes stop_codon:yes gene_type:complete